MFLQIITTGAIPVEPPNRKPQSSGRLDIQRRHLENKKMYHLNTMVLDDAMTRRGHELVARQRVALATRGQVTMLARIRLSLGTKLVALGERIRPETPVGDPRFNA